MTTHGITDVDDALVWKIRSESRGGVIKENIVAISYVTISGTESELVEAKELLKQVVVVL